MAWSSPRTWVAGTYPTAAQLNQELRDNLNAVAPLGPDAWTAYTTTITQSGTVTYTNNYSKYTKWGRTVTWGFNIQATAAGTAGNRVSLTLPVAAASSASIGIHVGAGMIYDASATTRYMGAWEILTTTTICFSSTASTSDAWGALPSIALASGDILRGTVTYETAS